MLREWSPPSLCHISHVTCHVSHVTCHITHVTRYVSQEFFLDSDSDKVCYQRCQASLV